MRHGLSATAGAVALVALCATSSHAEPRISLITQWSAGAEGDAINAVGLMVEEQGAVWEHDPVSGFTTDMMNALRADIIAGNPPAASQLKGPEIKLWSQIAGTRNLNDLVAATDYEAVVSEDLAALHRPSGDWIALPLQVYRTSTLFASRKAMDAIGETELPKTWDEFNALAARFEEAGITPVAHGGIHWADAMYFEIVLAGISPEIYRAAIMELDEDALRSKEVLQAFQQLRQMTEWMDPANAGQHWSVFIPPFMAGEYGFLLMGGWASGVFKRGGFEEGRDFYCGTAPHDSEEPVFVLNADGMIFWQTDDEDYQAGQEIFANVLMTKEFGETFSRINGSIPVRTDIDLTDAAFQPCQREAASNLQAAVEHGTTLLSLGHNMAQTNDITGALKEVLTEFVHNSGMSPEEAQDLLTEAALSAS